MSAPGGPPGPAPRSPASPAAAPRAAGPAQALTPGTAAAPGLGTLPERVAGAVLTHPDVVRLDGGSFGAIATYLPGRRVIGVALGEADEPARVGIVVRLGARVRPTADAVRHIVAAETGHRRVDVVVIDVEVPGIATPGLTAP